MKNKNIISSFETHIQLFYITNLDLNIIYAKFYNNVKCNTYYYLNTVGVHEQWPKQKPWVEWLS